MSLGKVPTKVGGGAKQIASLQQGAQVSTATTTGHRHTENLSGNTYQPLYSPRPAKRNGGWQTAAQMHDLDLEIARPPRVI